MPTNIKHINEIYLDTWKFESMRALSKFAVLFPNELRQDGGAFKSKIKFPLMTKAIIGNTWSQEEGVPLSDASEKVIEVLLDKTFNSHTKIAKVNIPADPSTWAANKAKMINQQEAKILDDYTLDQIAAGVVNKVEFESIDKDNLVEVFEKLEQEAEDKDFILSDAIIFVSPKIKTAIIKSKLDTVDHNVENTSIKVTRLFNTYNIVTAPIDKRGYDIIALPPSAYAWAMAVDIPLHSYEFTEGEFVSQLATVINEFYGSDVIQPEFVLGVPTTATD